MQTNMIKEQTVQPRCLKNDLRLHSLFSISRSLHLRLSHIPFFYSDVPEGLCDDVWRDISLRYMKTINCFFLNCRACCVMGRVTHSEENTSFFMHQVTDTLWPTEESCYSLHPVLLSWIPDHGWLWYHQDSNLQSSHNRRSYTTWDLYIQLSSALEKYINSADQSAKDKSLRKEEERNLEGSQTQKKKTVIIWVN